MHKTKNQVIGQISISSKGTGYVKTDRLKEDIEIDYKHLNTALNGDNVEVILHPKSGLRQTGEITRILKRAKTGFAGILEKEGDLFFVKPDDVKMYTDILISPKDTFGAKLNQKVFAEITSWDNPKLSPRGKIVKIFGNPGENNAEIFSIAKERGFDSDFPKKVIYESNAIKKRGIKKEDFSGRRDFRETLTFTIDPKDAKDFDDAISFKEAGTGLYEIGIHIADVTHYVGPNTEIDKEARSRGTSVYMVDRTIPMLPEVLSNDLCSLVPNQDRLTVSAVFVMDKNAKIKSEWFGKTVIFSKKRFTYEDAENSINNKNGHLHREISILNNLAKKLSQERIEKGAMILEQEEVKFILDKNGVPIKVEKKIIGESNKLIEEFMLLANKKIAEKISGHKISKKTDVFIYRIHDLPSQDKMTDLAFFLKSLGYKVSMKNGVIPTQEINKILKSLKKEDPKKDAISRAVVRSMAKAIYSTKNVGHYGLAFEHYTHFTSPIRRYPDMLVHRFLIDFINGKKIGKEKLLEFEEISKDASEQEKKAAEAERASIKYKQVEYMQKRIGQKFEGVISGLSEWGIFVEEKETKSEGLVRARDLNDDFYIFNEKKLEFLGKKTGKRYRLGDRIKVGVKSVDLEKKTIDYKIL